MNTLSRLLLVPLLLSASAASAAGMTVAELIKLGKVLEHDSVIVDTGKAHAADMCSGFSLTENQVRDFFKKAAVISDAELHKAYQSSPCTVQGHLLYHDQKVQYVISAASTGRIETSPGQYVEFGCNVCQDLFDYGYVVPPAPSTAASPQ